MPFGVDDAVMAAIASQLLGRAGQGRAQAQQALSGVQGPPVAGVQLKPMGGLTGGTPPLGAGQPPLGAQPPVSLAQLLMGSQNG